MSTACRAAAVAAALAVLTACSTAVAQTSQPASSPEQEALAPGLYAVFKTNMGEIVCLLYEKLTPATVANFVGLAEGTKAFTDPATGKEVKRPYYNGTIFHRVIPNFMIQGGDPTGTGRGGPGYEFEDEIRASLRFTRPGRLAMANRGPNTNGSQFFITLVPTPHLNGKHTIFGQVVRGQDVVDSIARVPRNNRDRPLTNVVLESVTIKRVE